MNVPEANVDLTSLPERSFVPDMTWTRNLPPAKLLDGWAFRTAFKAPKAGLVKNEERGKRLRRKEDLKPS